MPGDGLLASMQAKRLEQSLLASSGFLDRQPPSSPLGKAAIQAAGIDTLLAQSENGVESQHTVRAATVSNNLL